MRIRIRYIGSLADFLGLREEVMEFQESEVSVKKLLEALRDVRPGFRKAESRLPMIWVFLNDKQVLPSDKVRVKNGDIILVSPPLYEGG